MDLLNLIFFLNAFQLFTSIKSNNLKYLFVFVQFSLLLFVVVLLHFFIVAFKHCFSFFFCLPNRTFSASIPAKMVDSQYYLPNDIGVSALDCAEAFRLLSPQEKMYAHYLSRAAWYVCTFSLQPTNADIK